MACLRHETERRRCLIEAKRANRQGTQRSVCEAGTKFAEQVRNQRRSVLRFVAEIVRSISNVWAFRSNSLRSPHVALPKLQEPSARRQDAEARGDEFTGKRIQYNVDTGAVRCCEDIGCEAEGTRIKGVVHACRSQYF